MVQVTLAIFSLIFAHTLSARVITVGPGETYTNLQQAATEVSPGDNGNTFSDPRAAGAVDAKKEKP